MPGRTDFSKGIIMKIVSFHAENVKKLRVVDITPEGALVPITGRNGQGKSSVLDSIFWALGGTKDVPSLPVRAGEKNATIRLDLGEVTVTRKFTAAGGTSLIVENADGFRSPSPQEMLNKLVGSITFDPLEFSRMKPKDQAEMLRRLVKLDVDVDALDKANDADFATRTDTTRQAKALRAQADAITVAADLPESAVDVSALMDQMAAASEGNSLIERRRERRNTAAGKVLADRAKAVEIDQKLPVALDEITLRRDRAVADLEEQIKQIKARIEIAIAGAATEAAKAKAAMESEATALRAGADTMQAEIDAAEALPDPVDVAGLRAQIDAANATNKLIAERDRKASIAASAAAEEQKAVSLTAAMEGRAKTKSEAIAAAQMPIEGLSFTGGAVFYRDLPLDQASSAEQLRVSVAIAMAANPRLRVLRIKDGGLLDDDGMRLIEEMAEGNDYQVWVESVHSAGPMSIVMEDGMVVGTDAGFEVAAE
jgi:hypothetical protein